MTSPASLSPSKYCNRGTLLDAVERGWLRTKRTVAAAPNMLLVLLTARVGDHTVCFEPA